MEISSLAKIFTSVSIQYHILTTSDWTEFHLKEGGNWSNIQVEYIRGRRSLTEKSFNETRIKLHKNTYDKTPVEVRVNCNLDIYNKSRDAEILYLIEKGDIESTTVRIIVEGKEIAHLENTINAPKNPQNPMEFPVPVTKHLPMTKLRFEVNSMSQISRKLAEIRKLTLQRYKDYRRLMIVALSFLATMFISGIVVMRLIPEGQALWTQPLSVQILFVVCVTSGLIALFLGSKAERLSFEKKIFLKTIKAYDYLTRFVSLSGSSSQDESDLDKARKLLQKVSSELLARKAKVLLLDALREVNERYVELGKIIQTKILFYLQNRKEFPLIQQKTLELADTLADASLSRLHSCIASIEAIPQTGPFKPAPTFLEANPRLRSMLIHLGKFSGSVFLVTVVAIVLSYVFSKSLSELAPYILASTFVLFVGWEFKS